MQANENSVALRKAPGVVALLMLAYILSYVDRTVVLELVGPIRADLRLSDTQFSLLQGFAFAALYTIAGIPIGIWADRGDRRRIIAIGVAIWSVMTMSCGITRTFWQLFLARVGVGVGEAALSPAAYSLITDVTPRPQVGRALSAYGSGVYLGIGLSFLVGGWLVDTVVGGGGLAWPLLRALRPWQQIMVLVGMPGLPLAFAALLLLPEPRRATDAAWNPKSPERLVPYMVRHRRFLCGHFIGFACVSLMFNGYMAWLVEYFLRAHGWSKSLTGVCLGVIMLVCGPLGMAAGGIATDVIARRHPETAALRVGLFGAVALLPWPPWATVVSNPILALVGVAPIVFFSCFCFGPAVVALQVTTPERLRARISAVYLFTVNIAGIGLGGTAMALVSDRVLKDEARIGAAMAAVGSAAVVLAVLLLAFAFRSLTLRAAEPQAKLVAV